MNKNKDMILNTIAALSFVFVLSLPFLYVKFYMYHYVNEETAQIGIFFKDNIYLKEYKLIGDRNFGLIQYDVYTRSDRQVNNEVVRVIK